MRVYLAGKINGADEWRKLFVPGWGESIVLDQTSYAKPWSYEVRVHAADGHVTGTPAVLKDPLDWPVLPLRFLALADYVGPYAVGTEDDGGGHGTSFWPPNSCHGNYPDQYPRSRSYSRRHIAQRCMRAIDDADLVFAVFLGAESPGTLCEVGYAFARQRPVIAYAAAGSADWFPLSLCSHVREFSHGASFWDDVKSDAHELLTTGLRRVVNMDVYYRSPWWKRRRARAIELAAGKCQFCSSTANLSVHHNDYTRIYREPDSDLVVLCDPCHGTADAKRRLVEKLPNERS